MGFSKFNAIKIQNLCFKKPDTFSILYNIQKKNISNIVILITSYNVTGQTHSFNRGITDNFKQSFVLSEI